MSEIVTDQIQTELKRTPFTSFHEAAGAKMVPFAGFLMPVQYKGITLEHQAVRTNVGLFDLSHMGEFVVTGSEALPFLQKTTTNDVAALKAGQIQYSCMTYPDGGIVDDLLVYCFEDHYLLVVNAANKGKDFRWLMRHIDGDAQLIDCSSELGLLAIQGPNAEKVMAELTDHNLTEMKSYTAAVDMVAGESLMFSRTGYTGEDGFELYIPNHKCDTVWQAVVAAGEKYQMELIGLGARDSLRLEMKMALYGNDIDQSTSPIEAGLSWIVNLDKDFIGKEVIARQKAEKPSRKLVCLELEGRAFPRQGHKIFDGSSEIGQVTSGTVSPTLNKPIALGYVAQPKTLIGSQVEIEIRDKRFVATVVKPPFYKNASHK